VELLATAQTEVNVIIKGTGKRCGCLGTICRWALAWASDLPWPVIAICSHGHTTAAGSWRSV